MDKENKMKIRKLTDEELGAFNRELAMIMRAGILPSDAIAAMKADCADSRETEILQKLYEKLEAGSPLWEAAENAGVFPVYMLRMLKLGETSGRLQQVCTRLAEHYERLAEISASIRRAVTYPLIMLLLMVIVVTVLTVGVLPIFAGVYNDLGIELTAATAALMNFGEASKWIALGVALDVSTHRQPVQLRHPRIPKPFL
jgi:type IV pilus assembly protein PilC